MAGGSDTSSNNKDDAAINGMLAVARREVLILAATLQSNDDIGAVIAAGRLRWAISCAHEFAGRSLTVLSRLKARFAEIEYAAQQWLPEKIATIRDSEHLLQALAVLGDPFLGHRSVCANNALIVGFDLDGLPLANMKIRGATIARVTARGARLDNSDARGAMITHSCLNGASLRLTVLADTTMEECELSQANLEGTQWRDAKISKVTARGALLFHSELRAARFVDCDFRDADFQGFADSGTAGAEFVCCDLRRTNWHGRNLSGVSFVRCRLHGAFGVVTGARLARLEDSDLSADGDGSLIVSKDELLRRWPKMGVEG